MDKKINDFPGVGNRLRNYRVKAGFTAETLASAVKEKFPNTGVSRQTIFNIENERRRMDLSSLIEIARTLNINPLSLLCDLGQPFETVSDSGPLAGLTPLEVCSMFSIKRDSHNAHGKMDAPDKTEIGLAEIALNLAEKYETENEEPSLAESMERRYEIRMLEINGVELPENLKTFCKGING